MDFTTACVHGSDASYDRTGAISVPIFQTATFAHPGAGRSTGYDYSRLQNPTREHLEQTMARLEGGTEAMAFSTGMAAITALFMLFGPGSHIISSEDLYGGSRRLFDTLAKTYGIDFEYVSTSDLSAVEAAVTPATRAVFVETPTNPMMHVTDIAAISGLAQDCGLLLAVDNTFLTPYFQRPLALGADVVVHSGTKFLAGHNDTLAGFLVTADMELGERLRFIYKTTGACLSPFDSWLVTRGIKTLAVRLDRQQASAQRIAGWLLEQPKVRAVYYVGLPDHPDIEVSRRQTSGFGSMISFEVDSEETAARILEGVRLIQFAESLGGVESLITYPVLQTHADVPEGLRRRLGVNERLLRLSVGLEDVNDLVSDLYQAMEGA